LIVLLKYGKLVEGPPKPKGKNPRPEKFFAFWFGMRDRRRSVLQYNDTDGQDEKHGLQRNFEIMMKTGSNDGYICEYNISH
jgi:hypothetical protein